MPVKDFPIWLRRRVEPEGLLRMQKFLKERKLETVCESALCPNRGDCYGRGRATFMILGNVCTRNCSFCAVFCGLPEAVDLEEPLRIAKAVKELKLRQAVITSVSRDDLIDRGADQFGKVIREIKKFNSETIVEVLVPDFQGSVDSIEKVVEAGPDIFNHNLETIPRLYPELRPGADYQRSLKVLRTAKEINSKIITKSGLMLGLGEKFKEVKGVMDDLRKNSCDILTLGQYLAPSSEHWPIKEFVLPEIFEKYKELALKKGFLKVFSGPFVRSSYCYDS